MIFDILKQRARNPVGFRLGKSSGVKADFRGLGFFFSETPLLGQIHGAQSFSSGVHHLEDVKPTSF